MKTLRDALIILGLFIGGWILFSYLPWFSEEGGRVISVEQESELGDLLSEVALSDYDLDRFEGTAPDSALERITDHLLESYGLTEYDYNFYLVQEEVVNAFALPGGNIVVLSGLMDFAEGPEEVAAVLAHEIGHIEQAHVLDRLMAEFGLTILFSVLSGGDAMIISELVQSLMSSSFSRRQEAEADDFALNLLEKSRINPHALGTFFRRLKREQGDWDSTLEPILSHPSLNSRIKKSLEFKLDPNFQAVDFKIDWERVREQI